MSDLRRHQRVIRTCIYAVIFFGVFGTYVLRSVNDGTLRLPPEPGDGADYDALAFNIWQHRAFGFSWDDPEFRQPYLHSPPHDYILRRHGHYYPTTYRPPAVPLLMSLVYAVTHRNFGAWRIVNCAVVAGAVTIASAVSVQLAGLLAAVLTALLALQFSELSDYSAIFMTEGLAMFFVTLLAWIWLRNARKGWTAAGAITSGIVLGALVATRSIFVLWMPLALLMPGKAASSGATGAWRLKLMCVLVSLLVVGPWWVRNIVVTNAFMPLGTEGALNLPAGFGPRAVRSEGMWEGNPDDGAKEVAALKLDPVTSEVRLAKFRSRLVTAWIQEHPFDALHLMYQHVWQEVRPRGDLLANSLLPAAGLAALIFSASPGARIIFLMFCANILGTAMTWSVGGRFMVPLQPFLLALVGALIATIVRYIATLDGPRPDPLAV
jgi:hypothetical protein